MKQNRVKDYSGWRIVQTDNEVIDGKTVPVQKSHPDIQGIKEDILKTRPDPREFRGRLRRGLPKVRK